MSQVQSQKVQSTTKQ